MRIILCSSADAYGMARASRNLQFGKRKFCISDFACEISVAARLYRYKSATIEAPRPGAMLLQVSLSDQPKEKRNIFKSLEILTYGFESWHDGDYLVLRLSVKPDSKRVHNLNLLVRKSHTLELISTPNDENYFYKLHFNIQSIKYEVLIDKLDFVSQLFKFNPLFRIIHSISQ